MKSEVVDKFLERAESLVGDDKGGYSAQEKAKMISGMWQVIDYFYEAFPMIEEDAFDVAPSFL